MSSVCFEKYDFVKTVLKETKMGKDYKLFELYDQYKYKRSGGNKDFLLTEVQKWKKKSKCPHKNGETLLNRIILDSCNELAEEIIEIGFGINTPSDTGMYPIHHAVYMDNIGMVHLLLDNGAEINTPERQQQNTPLHIALKRPEVTRHMVSFLVRKGANSKQQNVYKEDAYELAKVIDRKNQDSFLVDILEKKHCYNEPGGASGIGSIRQKVMILERQSGLHTEKIDQHAKQIQQMERDIAETRSEVKETAINVKDVSQKLAEHVNTTSSDIKSLEKATENLMNTITSPRHPPYAEPMLQTQVTNSNRKSNMYSEVDIDPYPDTWVPTNADADTSGVCDVTYTEVLPTAPAYNNRPLPPVPVSDFEYERPTDQQQETEYEAVEDQSGATFTGRRTCIYNNTKMCTFKCCCVLGAIPHCSLWLGTSGAQLFLNV